MSKDARRSPVSRKPSLRKKIAFSLLPLVALILLAELGCRLVGWDRPAMTVPLIEGNRARMHSADDELFWKLLPNLDTVSNGVRIRTNRIGLRDTDIRAKRSDEFRILSLGESTTFGHGVENEQTYSALLQDMLAEAEFDHSIRVINAGVSGYTSFQSLQFLKQSSPNLNLDMVLFYHELNDFLPSSIRTNDFMSAVPRSGSATDESGLMCTDRQYYRSHNRAAHRELMSLSAIYRSINFLVSRRAIEALQTQNAQQMMMPNVMTPAGLRQLELPSRVSAEERKEIMEELLAHCRRNEIQLVMIHPAYRDSKRHACDLTRFCQRNSVPMFAAFDSLHADTEQDDQLYLDSAHPNPEGHRRVARDLAEMLTSQHLIKK